MAAAAAAGAGADADSKTAAATATTTTAAADDDDRLHMDLLPKVADDNASDLAELMVERVTDESVEVKVHLGQRTDYRDGQRIRAGQRGVRACALWWGAEHEFSYGITEKAFDALMMQLHSVAQKDSRRITVEMTKRVDWFYGDVRIITLPSGGGVVNAMERVNHAELSVANSGYTWDGSIMFMKEKPVPPEAAGKLVTTPYDEQRVITRTSFRFGGGWSVDLTHQVLTNRFEKVNRTQYRATIELRDRALLVKECVKHRAKDPQCKLIPLCLRLLEHFRSVARAANVAKKEK